MVRQPDGGLIVGGRFTMIDGIARSNLARLTPSGALDTTWNPSLDGEVFALAVNADGDVYVGGAFTEVNGQRHDLVAKLSGKGNGAVDTDWDPGFADARTQDWQDYRANALALDSRGSLFIGGEFLSAGGQRHENLVKVSANGRGTVDANWNPQVSDVVALAIDRNGAVYVATDGLGMFALLIRKFSGTGSGTPAADWTPTISGSATSLAVGPDGALYAAGRFSLHADHWPLVKFPASGRGAIASNWNPAVSYADTLAFDGSGALYVSGAKKIAKLSAASGNVDVAWSVSTSGKVHVLTSMDNGSLYAGGEFDDAAGQEASSIARLAVSDGASSPTAGAQVAGEVTAIARQANGGLIVGGRFFKSGAATRRNLLRVAADGTLDRDWNPSFDSAVQALAVDGDGDVYVVPQVPSYGHPCRLAKFAGSGRGDADPDWTPVFGQVHDVAADGYGHIYVLGYVFGYGLARVSRRDATLDSLWTPELDGTGRDIVVDDAGAIYASVYSQEGRTYSIAKFRANSVTAEMEWNVPMTHQATALVQGPDGSLYAGIAPHGYPFISEIVKIAPNGVMEASWTELAESGAPMRYVRALAIGADQAVYVGGSRFPGNDVPPRGFVMKLSADLRGTLPDWNPAPNGTAINVLLPDIHGGVLVGGDFSAISGQSHAGMAVLPTAMALPQRPRLRPAPIRLRPIRAPAPYEP